MVRLEWEPILTVSSCNRSSKEIKLNLKHFNNENGELIVNGAFYIFEGMVDNLNNEFHVLRMWSPPAAQTRSFN